MRVAVITPSLPGRGAMLAEAIATAAAQTLMPTVHLVAIDHQRVGTGATLNALARGAGAEWLAVLDDDDLLDNIHLETLAGAAADADVVYTWCRVAPRSGGSGDPVVPSVLASGEWTPNEHFDPDVLRVRNFIPATTLIRRALWEELGGWSPSPPPGYWEDYDFWLRALDAGARFVCVPEVTWTYRFHGENQWLR